MIPKLHDAQRVAVTNAEGDISSQGFAIIKAGQRSGKAVMAAHVASKYKIVSVMSLSEDASKQWYDEAFGEPGLPLQDTIRFNYNALPDPGVAAEDVLVVLDEAFWNNESRYIFNIARRRGYSVLAIGSNGPEFPAWRSLGGWGYNTWDLNPALGQDDLKPYFAADLALAVRDFCAF